MVAKDVVSKDLEARVQDRKRELIAEAVEYKTNSSRHGAGEAFDRIKLRLSELAYIVKQGGTATADLEEWMSR
ncbi:MAG: hypothetical protein ABI175_16355 [Polyangiales bacterium]